LSCNLGTLTSWNTLDRSGRERNCLRLYVNIQSVPRCKHCPCQL